MSNSPDPTEMVAAPREEPFVFSSRLSMSYVLAGISWVAADRSLFVLAVAFIGWLYFTGALFWRFGLRGAWALAGAPLALFWVWRVYVEWRVLEMIV